jgi:hypothetical protein
MAHRVQILLPAWWQPPQLAVVTVAQGILVFKLVETAVLVVV